MKTEAKSPIVAFLLTFIPGFGHLYIGRAFRFVLYAGGFFGPLALIVFGFIAFQHMDEEFLVFMLGISGLFWAINGIDMLITLAKGKHRAFRNYTELPNGTIVDNDPLAYFEQQEKTKVMLLSVVPGLAHMYMGLLQRGITLLISFVAVFGGVLFVSIVMNSAAVLVLWLALPIIWVYSMFDGMSILAQKQRGELLNDQSLFEHLEHHLASGKKSRGAAMVLSIFPGVGHLYIGLQQRGLQLMGLFLLGIFIMDQLRLTLFIFLLPMLWCYAFFDVMTQLRKLDEKAIQDEPILLSITPYQRWIGAGLLVIGAYYLIDRITLKLIQFYDLKSWFVRYQEIKYMLPTVVIAFILILLGIKLLFGTSSNKQTSRYKGDE